MYLRDDSSGEKEGFQSNDWWRNLFHAQLSPVKPSDNPPGQLTVNSRITDNIPDFDDKFNQVFTTSALFGGERTYGAGNKDYRRLLNKQAVGLQDERNAFCRGITHPRHIPARLATDTEGCGWVYVPDVTVQAYKSVSRWGAADGPTDTTGYPNVTGTTWIWNIAEATKREDIKLMARIKDCSIATQNTGCGFCKAADGSVGGTGIPVDPSTGQLKYVGVGDPTCDGNRLVVNRSDCPRIPAGAPLTGDTWTIDTVLACLTAKDFGPKTDTSNGQVQQGLFYRFALQKKTSTGSPVDLSTTLPVLKVMGSVEITQAMLSGTAGATTVQQFNALLDRVIVCTQYVGEEKKQLRDVAILAKDGQLVSQTAPYTNVNFDICDYYSQNAADSDPTIKSLATVCLQQEFRKARCQAGGTKYPQTNSLSGYVGKTLGDIKAEFRSLYDRMFNSPTASEQSTAIEQCLGVAGPSAADTSLFCDEPGIEYFVFSIDDAGTKTLVKRFVSTAGLLADPNLFGGSKKPGSALLKTTLDGLTEGTRVGYKARTMVRVTSPTPMIGSWFSMPDTYTIRVNDAAQLMTRLRTATTVPGTLQYKADITLPATDRQRVELDYVGKRGATIGNPDYRFIDLNLQMFQLFQKSTDPVIRYAFGQKSFADQNLLTRITGTENVVFTDRGGATGITWRVKPTGPGYTLPVVSVKLQRGQIHAISTRVYLETAASQTLYTIYETPTFQESVSLSSVAVTYTLTTAKGAQTKSFPIPASQVVVGTWINILLVFQQNTRTDAAEQRDELDVSCWLGSTKLGEKKTVIIEGYAAPYKKSVQLSIIDSSFQGVLQTFHVYDVPVETGARIAGFANPTASIGIADLLTQETGGTLVPKEPKLDRGTVSRDYSNTALDNVGVDTFYNKAFKKLTNPANDYQTTKVEKALDCYNTCDKDSTCLGFTFKDGSCTLYNQMASGSSANTMTDSTGAISVYQPGRNYALVGLQMATANRIREYWGLKLDSQRNPQSTEPSYVRYLKSQTFGSGTTATDLYTLLFPTPNEYLSRVFGMTSDSTKEPVTVDQAKADFNSVFSAAGEGGIPAKTSAVEEILKEYTST